MKICVSKLHYLNIKRNCRVEVGSYVYWVIHPLSFFLTLRSTGGPLCPLVPPPPLATPVRDPLTHQFDHIPGEDGDSCQDLIGRIELGCCDGRGQVHDGPEGGGVGLAQALVIVDVYDSTL